MNELKALLLKAYGCADKRIKHLEKMTNFIIDDRAASDHNSRNELYPYFCSIFATVADEGRIQLQIHNLPWMPGFESWLRPGDSSTVERVRCRLSTTISPADVTRLERLAEMVEGILATRPYPEPSFKYVCPRTAGSLRRFSQIFGSFEAPASQFRVSDIFDILK